MIWQRRLRQQVTQPPGVFLSGLILESLNFVDDSLEGFGVVEGEVSEDFTVDFDTGFVDEAHELGVAQVVHACGSVDTLDPESAEVAFFVLAVAVCVCETFLPGVFGYGPYVTAASEVAAGKFQDFFATCA